MWTVIATALLSALATAAVMTAGVWWLYERRLRPLIEAELALRVERYGEIIEQRVRAGIVTAVDDVTSVEALQKSVSRSQDTFLQALFGIPTREK